MEPDAVDAGTRRRQKKRESDRKAQRLSRERTRQRIEHLEFIVEKLRSNTQQAESAALVERVEQVKRERDGLLESLRSIEGLARRHIAKYADSSRSGSQSADDDSNQRPLTLPTPPSSASIAGIAPLCLPMTHSSSESGHHFYGSKWEKTKHTLKKPEMLTEGEASHEHFLGRDVPVRAILEGWDAVEATGKMSNLWRVLRQIEELCFSSCGIIERIAIMRMMHLLMMYHVDPSPRNFEMIPAYYWMRPSQAIPHPYAIDFFPWPGLRERLVFSEHRYSSHEWAEAFLTNLKVQWPYGVGDVYTRSAMDGTYSISPLFDRHIRDLQVWTMGPDLFRKFPELVADIPAHNSIPSMICGNLGEEENSVDADGKDAADLSRRPRGR